MAKKSFGKNLLRLSSMLIAVIMLVTMMFTGVVSAEQAEDFGTGNTIQITGYAWVQCGQNVVLEAGKTYMYSYYHEGPKSVGGVMYYGDGTGTTVVEKIATYVDQDVKKVTYKFVAPAEATPAEEEGKVKIYLGFQIPSADTYHIYYPCVYAVDDATKTNLFYDYLITGKYSVANKDGGNDGKVNWYKPYDDAVIGYRATKPNLESLGGVDIFNKTDAERNVIALAAGSAMSKAFFGQKIALEGGKTYVFSNYYSGTENAHVFRKDDGSYSNVYADVTNLDSNWRKVTSIFTVPTDMIEDENGKKPFWVGLQCASTSATDYFYGLKLYDIENPEINLLQDADLAANDTGFDAIWRKPSTALEAGYYTKTTLAAVGGMDIFKKADAERHVLKLTPNMSGMPYFGQRVLLEPGKTYEYSNYFLSHFPANQEVWYIDVQPEGESKTQLTTEVVSYEGSLSKQGIKFTVPADASVNENGKVVIYVGFRGNLSETPLYYFDLKLNDVTNPELNLLADADLSGADFEVKADTWKTPSGNYINTAASVKYSEVTLESIGGMNAFLPYEVKCDLTGDEIVDIRDLVRMKRYSVGAVETLLEGTGDLDCDTEFAGSGDMVLLRKEILK